MRNGLAALAATRRRVHSITFEELLDVVQIWVAAALRLKGAKPDEAFFVKCDRTTMTQDDIDNGRLICVIGIAPVKPAEFVIFRIQQKTLDTTSR